MQQKDPFTGRETFLEGSRLPGAEGWAAVLDGHRQRLRALDQLGEKAAECSFAAHQDRSLVLAVEDEVGLLEFAEACDVPVKWACRTGVCHTCECALIGGSVRYDPEPLDPPAEGNVLICCSRPETEVALDL